MDREQEQDQSSLATPEAPVTKPSARFRLSLASLMAIVLAVGIARGFMLRESDRRRREGRMWGEISRQREVTFMILHLPDPIVRQHAPVQPLQWSRQWARNTDSFEVRSTIPDPFPPRGSGQWARKTDSFPNWIDGKRIWLIEKGERHNLVNLALTGDAKDLVLTPIVIEDRGGELNAHFIDRLTEAYRANHWAYRVVPAARDDGARAEPH